MHGSGLVDHPSLYRLPMCDASSDILEDIDDCISSPSIGMQSKKVSKLLPYPGICSRQYHHVEGQAEVIWYRTLPLVITEF